MSSLFLPCSGYGLAESLSSESRLTLYLSFAQLVALTLKGTQAVRFLGKPLK
jgi:hypothetical protein